jgi:hypothetical protein
MFRNQVDPWSSSPAIGRAEENESSLPSGLHLGLLDSVAGLVKRTG